MERENAVEILQRFRRDRRILLEFILSGSLIKKVIMPPGAVSLDDVDLDQISVDYVLGCAKKGGLLELSEAIRDFHDRASFPHMSNTGSTDEFFLVTDPDHSGSPPKRAPPTIAVTPSPIVPSLSKSLSFNSTQEQELTVDDIEDFENDNNMEEVDYIRSVRRNFHDVADVALQLPSFATGITDDDLRETAYEILLASAGAAGGLIVPSKEKNKDKKSKLMRKLGRSKREDVLTASQQTSGLVGLLEVMRVQMEISEAMDIRTRQGLLNGLVGKAGKRMDTLLIPLEFLCCISRTEFSDRKAFIRWQKRQLNILEEGLINHPVAGFSESGRNMNELKILLAKIEESEFLPPPMGELQRSECLRSLREITIPLAARPARGDLTGEVCHWADGYHLNVRLYEKLLFSVFDILEEGKLAEEVEEILELLKSTWRVLGITETIHCTCYSWVLFHQFVITSERGILKHAIERLLKIPSSEQRGQQERSHLRSLHSKVEGEEGLHDQTFLQSFLSPIMRWTEKQLGDYHLHFSERATVMEDLVSGAMIARRLLLEESDPATQSIYVRDQDQIELYISSSLKHAFSRNMLAVESISNKTGEHPLALLAEEAQKLLKKETTIFMPILSQRHSRAIVFSASFLHRQYGNKLKLFLGTAEHLTEDVVSVLPAAYNLEQYIMMIISSACGDDIAGSYYKKLNLYQIEEISGTLILRWVNSQLGRILNWVERAVQQERWDPISPQQRHGSSIVEVFRIVEEALDQFFAHKVPMRSGELHSLLRGVDNAFQVYANRIIEKLASKEELIPPEPILTRYKKEVGIKAFVKKEPVDPRLADERQASKINVLTTPTLCIQLNTLYYAVSQLNKLEDTIWERWTKKRSLEESPKRPLHVKQRSSTQKEVFDGSRKNINAAIDSICEFTGTKIIFWDLREPFIENLYRHTVSQSRLETLIESLDMALNQLCDIIVEPLRDRIVMSLLQASLDGLLRVILNGGSSRLFFPADVKLLEEDLEILKEFFISGGDGLPRGVVENQVARVRNVIKLHGYETRELIEDLKGMNGLEMQSGGSSRLGADPPTLLRILCHRSDSEASNFLKKQYKIPRSTA